jgi:hypothetical protein
MTKYFLLYDSCRFVDVGRSDERTGLSFARVTVSSNVSCQYVQFTFDVIKCIYNIYKAFVSPGSVQQIMPRNSSGHFAP